jgi:HEAT repeat protein
MKRNKDHLPNILSNLSNKDPYQKMMGAVKLTKMDNIPLSTLPLLIEAFQDDDVFVKRWCAIAFGRIGSEATAAGPYRIEALEALVPNSDNLIADRSFFAIETCVSALGKIGIDQAVPILTRLLDHKRRSIRMAAAKALYRIGTEDAISALRGFAEPW